ncbi:MAG: hypothetical protein F6K39_31225, partial [Okeania sp. SIO3B3]|nr:hypothetical protein [Okeania sp. SIO3B3]
QLQRIFPLQLDTRSPKKPVGESMYQENRFKMLTKSKPTDAKQLLAQAQEDVNTRYAMYEYLAARKLEMLNGNGNGNGNSDAIKTPEKTTNS